MRIDSPEIVGELSVEAGSTSVLTGSFTGSFAGDGSGLTGVAPIAGAGVVVTGTTVSIGQDVATTSSVTFNEIGASNVTLTGTITAATGTFVYQIFESSSTIITSGSNIFGNDASDIQQITGSIFNTGSFNVSGSSMLSGSLSITGSTEVIGAVSASSTGRFLSLGINTAPSGVAGAILATNDVVAFASSDERLKENLEPIGSATEKVEQMTGYTFNWVPMEDVHVYGDMKDIGVVAQEVEKVLPELVSDRENGYKAVKYEKLTAVLIQAVKELSERVKTLEGYHNQ